MQLAHRENLSPRAKKKVCRSLWMGSLAMSAGAAVGLLLSWANLAKALTCANCGTTSNTTYKWRCIVMQNSCFPGPFGVNQNYEHYWQYSYLNCSDADTGLPTYEIINCSGNGWQSNGCCTSVYNQGNCALGCYS